MKEIFDKTGAESLSNVEALIESIAQKIDEPTRQEFLQHLSSALFEWTHVRTGAECSCCGGNGKNCEIPGMVGLHIARAWNATKQDYPEVFQEVVDLLGIRLVLKDVPLKPASKEYGITTASNIVDALIAHGELNNFGDQQRERLELSILNGLCYLDDQLVERSDQTVQVGQTVSIRYDYPYPQHLSHPRMRWSDNTDEEQYVECIDRARDTARSTQDRMEAVLGALACDRNGDFRGNVCNYCTCVPTVEYTKASSINFEELLVVIRRKLQEVID